MQILKIWRGLLWFYAIGSGLTGLAALLFGYSLLFASAVLVFSATAFWALHSRTGRATLQCGVAGLLPMLGAIALLGPTQSRLILLTPSLVGGALWMAVCYVVARQLRRDKAHPVA